jgi:hypothetical protein
MTYLAIYRGLIFSRAQCLRALGGWNSIKGKIDRTTAEISTQMNRKWRGKSAKTKRSNGAVDYTQSSASDTGTELRTMA